MHAYELSITAMFQNEGPYLKEWIEYHRMVGVEHFWLYNDASTDDWREVLEPYIAEGIVEVVDRPSGTLLNFISTQQSASIDALKKAKGITTWLALIDLDEFLLPENESTVTECLTNHFANASAVYVNWFHFGTGGINLNQGESILFGLTACGEELHPQNSTGKSIVRPDHVNVDAAWNIHHFVLQQGHYCDGDTNPLSFVGLDLNLSGKPHNQFIRLNHYYTRDEYFFNNVKLQRTRGIGVSESLVMNHYSDFNQCKDEKIIHFIQQKHPDMFEKFWRQRIFSASTSE
jgi:hypothetical protein